MLSTRRSERCQKIETINDKRSEGEDQVLYTFLPQSTETPPSPYQHKKINIPQCSTTSALGNGSLNALHSSPPSSSVLDTSSAECVSLNTNTLVLTQSLTPPFMPDVASHEASIVGARLGLAIEDRVLECERGEKVVLPFCAEGDKA